MNNGKQNILIPTKPHRLVTLTNALGDLVRNYDLTAHNQKAIIENARRNNAIYAKNRPTKPLVKIGNAEINNKFLEVTTWNK